MSSLAHGSEEAMARVALGSSAPGTAPNLSPAATPGGRRVLVGGLGLGFTLRATLDALAPSDAVTVVEISEAVIAWNRGPLAHLAASPLSDARVTVVASDLVAYIAATTDRFDAILLDVDNGPVAMSHATNAYLYQARGLAALRNLLRPRGTLVIWSAGPDRQFENVFAAAGFTVTAESVATRPGTRARHVLFVGRRV
ncbi:MAG: hypothetical protein IPL79_06475 [Myxococcales bacterium]|nr:hypothetical protein [Myxococcales bacterium]